MTSGEKGIAVTVVNAVSNAIHAIIERAIDALTWFLEQVVAFLQRLRDSIHTLRNDLCVKKGW